MLKKAIPTDHLFFDVFELAAFFLGGFPTKVLTNNPTANISEFFDLAQKGKLPSFTLIDPDYQASDDHPAHNIQRGQAFVASVYKALAESPAWSKTLLVITYDENGGFFDHVVPPKTTDDNAEFAQLGFRVPAFVIGPTVKKGYVCKTVLEHSSVARSRESPVEVEITLVLDQVEVVVARQCGAGRLFRTRARQLSHLGLGHGLAPQPAEPRCLPD